MRIGISTVEHNTVLRIDDGLICYKVNSIEIQGGAPAATFRSGPLWQNYPKCSSHKDPKKFHSQILHRHYAYI